jgi:hypothetical protein
MGFSCVRFAADEVEAAGRYAWWLPSDSDTLDASMLPLFAYDGCNFWCYVASSHDGVMKRRLVARRDVPTTRWRHRASCRCEGCRQTTA